MYACTCKQKIKQKGEQAVDEIFKNLIAKDVYFKLIQDFDSQSTKEAIFAHKCDKLECDIQARLYSDEGVLKKEYAGEIKNNSLIKSYEKKGIMDVADYFVLTDRKHFSDTDDIFLKISKYIEGKKILKTKKVKNTK